MVVTAEVTHKDAIRSALHRIAATKGRVVGTLLVRYDLSNHGGYYGYGGYGYYSYGPQTGDSPRTNARPRQ